MKIFFGPHKGEHIYTLPTAYLHWLVKNISIDKSDANQILVEECVDELEERRGVYHPNPGDI